MTIGFSMHYSVINTFLQKISFKIVTGRLVPDLFSFILKKLFKVKASGQQLRFKIFW